MTDRNAGPSTGRRRVLGVVGGALIGGTAVTRIGGASTDGAVRSQETETPTPTPTPPESIWPLYQYDAMNTGAWPGGRGPVGEPGARWGHLDGGDYVSTPVATEAEVFAADEGTGTVRAIDRTTGAELWQQSIDVAASRMTIRDRRLYVPTRESGAQLQVLRADDGTREWSVNLGSSANGVVVSGNSVVVSTPGGVVRVSQLSNEVDWQFDGVTLHGTSVAVGNNSVYAAGSQYGKVVKLSISDGSRSWSTNLDGTAQDAPTVAGNHVVVPFEEYLVALKEESGREVWRYDQPTGGSVVIDDGVVYGTTTAGEVFSLDLDDGQERWRTDVVEGSLPPLLVADQLYVTGTDGTLAAVNPSTGSVAWSTNVGAELAANPAVAGGELYTADRAGRIGALAAGASGGFGEPTPTPTDTPTGTETGTSTRTDSQTPTPTEATGGGGNGNGGNGNSGSSGDTPRPSTPARSTDTPGDSDGGLDLPLIGGGVAAAVALLGGGLWWRNQQQDDHDPLG